MQTCEAQARSTVAHAGESGRNPQRACKGAEACTAAAGQTKSEAQRLMEAAVERSNMWQAYQRVIENKGAPGVDGLKATELKDWLKRHWPRVKEALLKGEYIPQAVRKVEIPKPQGGVRTLGIPTVVDRLIQQALHQTMRPLFEPEFSEHSYGFRPGRNAWQAVKAARRYVETGKRWVVDIDLEKFFDRVNHDILMSKVRRKVKDERVLKLIRRYLEAGMMEGGLISPRTEGTPQGGPLSPLLSNILLTELDWELEKRGHRFCRYADDCNIYVGSRKAGENLMTSLSRYLEEKLKLKVNHAKSAVGHPWERKFLGYSLTRHKKSKLRIAESSVKRLADKIRETLKGATGRSLAATIEKLNPLLRGWASYFRLTESKRVLEELDGWVRRKLRAALWRQWKRPYARARNLMKRGLSEERSWRSASNGRGPWWNSGASHMNEAFRKRYFDQMGLVSLLDAQRRFKSVS